MRPGGIERVFPPKLVGWVETPVRMYRRHEKRSLRPVHLGACTAAREGFTRGAATGSLPARQ